MGVAAINSLDEFNAKINSGNPVLVDFWATWCGPCRVISPIFEKLSGEVGGVEFCKVDVDEQQAISQEAGIRAMPTFILFQNGQKVSEVVGAVPQKLQELVTAAASLV